MIPTPSQIKSAAGLVLVLLACLTTHKCTADHYKLKMERKERVAAEQVAKYEAAARDQEQKWAAAFDVTAHVYQEKLTDAQKNRDRIMRDVAAGRLRLPAACPAAQVPAVAADSGQPVAGAEGGQPAMVGELVNRLAVCDEVTIERNHAVELLKIDRSAITAASSR